MLNEKDRAAVASMARTGMNLETLKRCFPKFDEKDVEYVFKEETSLPENTEEISISYNCS